MATPALVIDDLNRHRTEFVRTSGFPVPKHRRTDGSVTYQFSELDDVFMVSVREQDGARTIATLDRVQAIVTGLGCPDLVGCYVGVSQAGVHYWAWTRAADEGARLGPASPFVALSPERMEHLAKVVGGVRVERRSA